MGVRWNAMSFACINNNMKMLMNENLFFFRLLCQWGSFEWTKSAQVFMHPYRLPNDCAGGRQKKASMRNPSKMKRKI